MKTLERLRWHYNAERCNDYLVVLFIKLMTIGLAIASPTDMIILIKKDPTDFKYLSGLFFLYRMECISTVIESNSITHQPQLLNLLRLRHWGPLRALIRSCGGCFLSQLCWQLALPLGQRKHPPRLSMD